MEFSTCVLAEFKNGLFVGFHSEPLRPIEAQTYKEEAAKVGTVYKIIPVKFTVPIPSES